MPRLVRFTVPTGESIFINADAVVNVHAVFKSESWAEDARTVIVYGDSLKVAVTEDVQFVVSQLNDRMFS